MEGLESKQLEVFKILAREVVVGSDVDRDGSVKRVNYSTIDHIVIVDFKMCQIANFNTIR